VLVFGHYEQLAVLVEQYVVLAVLVLVLVEAVEDVVHFLVTLEIDPQRLVRDLDVPSRVSLHQPHAQLHEAP
jgi:hypothetical protein